jgi:hypothetical protein
MQYKYQGYSIEPFVKRQLAAINRVLLDSLTQKQILSIDEVVIVSNNGKAILSVTESDREISGKNLLQLARQLKIERSEDNEPVIICLEGQQAENFDLLVPVTIFDEDFSPIAEYLVFGNYLGGTLEDLKTSPRWIEAQNLFFSFAESASELLNSHR